MSLEKIVANLVQKIERRFYGKYRGTVVDNADPEQLGRLKLQVPSVLGNTVVTGWALPCVPYGGDANQGMLFIPEVGAGVWVEFEEGDLEFPIWVGTFWSKPGGTSELPLPSKPDGSEDSAVQDLPTRKIIKTLAGHTLQLEDKQGDEMVLIVEAANGNVIVMNKDGITITDGANNHKIVLDNKGISVTDGTNSNNQILLDNTGITVQDTNSNKIVLQQSGITIEDKNGNKITLDAMSGGIPGMPGAKINGEKKVCLEGLISWLMNHTHIGNMGAPCPLNPKDIKKLAPVLAVPDGDILSKKVKLG